MDEMLTRLRQGLAQFGERVDAIRPDQWDNPTPDTEWTVRDLVSHVLDEQRWAPPLLEGHDLETAARIVEGAATTHADSDLTVDLKAEWQDVAIASEQAFGEPEALERDVALSRGPTPARAYLAELIFDLTVHGWDLGKGIGYEGDLPEDLVSHVFGMLTQLGDLSEYAGMFAKPVQVSDDAPMIDRLVAATGRRPR